MFIRKVSFKEIVSTGNHLPNMLPRKFHPWYYQGGTSHYVYPRVLILGCEGIHYLPWEGTQPLLSSRKPFSWKLPKEITYQTHTTFK
jgi:hypothetical protein